MYDIGFLVLFQNCTCEIQGETYVLQKKALSMNGQKYDVKEENGEIYIDV